MKSDILRRIMRAIAMGSQEDLNRLAQKVVDAERRSGHSRLADELDTILRDTEKRRPNRNVGIDTDRSIQELPVSRRHRDVLVTLIPSGCPRTSHRPATCCRRTVCSN